jgi:hypothetical protein
MYLMYHNHTFSKSMYIQKRHIEGFEKCTFMQHKNKKSIQFSMLS